MWRSSRFLLRVVSSTLGKGGNSGLFISPVIRFSGLASRVPELDNEQFRAVGSGGIPSQKDISFTEAKKLLRLANVEALKATLGTDRKEAIPYAHLLKTCEDMGIARSADEAAAFAKALDEAGVVLVFRDMVYLHPQKVLDIVRRAIPLALVPENDSKLEEIKKFEEKKKEIDMLAHKHVRRILWTGLGVFVMQVGLFFRLTFWEFSWDVMEPIAFFTTSTGLLLGYAYFLFTSRDPTYQDFMKRLFCSRQRKLMQKHNFDMNRYMELQKQCKLSLGSMEEEVDRAYKE